MQIWDLSLWLAETNAYVVTADGPGGECVLIDAPPDPAAILGLLGEHQLRLVALLSTHGHVDHVGGMSSVVRGVATGGRASGPGAHPRQRPPHAARSGRHERRPRQLPPAGGRRPERIEGLDDGQVLRGAGLTFTCIHTPGHTEGSVCFRLDVEGKAPVLFSGDHLFAGSIGRMDLPGGSLDAREDPPPR